MLDRAPAALTHHQADLDDATLGKTRLDKSPGLQYSRSATPFSRSHFHFGIPRSPLSVRPSFSVKGHTPSVVAHASPVGDAWKNHFSAFGEQDVDKILKDYTDKSEVIVYNTVT